MLTIKKYCVLVSIFFFCLSGAPADSGPGGSRYSFSLNPLSGILYGQSEEIVYKYSGEDTYLSQLLWDIKPIVYAGLGADFGPKDIFEGHGFAAKTTVKAGLPLRSGIIEDRDWLNAQHDWLTHYSKHDAHSRFSLLADISAGYSWRLSSSLALGLYGEFSYMYFSWSARNGYKQYPNYPPAVKNSEPPWDESYDKVPTDGEGIRYRQNWLILSPALSLHWKISRYFSLDGFFNYTPLIYCADRDDHLDRVPVLIFWDYMVFGHYFQWGGAFTLSPKKNLDLSLTVNGRYIMKTRGMTQEKAGSDPVVQTSNDGAGVGFKAVDFGFYAKFKLTGRD